MARRRSENSEMSMSHITPHESDAEFFTMEDVEHDVVVLSNVLLEKRIKNLSRALLQCPEILTALQNLVAGGYFANEAEALTHAVHTLQFALRRVPRARVSS